MVRKRAISKLSSATWYFAQVFKLMPYTNTARIHIVTPKFDPYLNMFFPVTNKALVDSNPEDAYDIGDVLLVKKIPRGRLQPNSLVEFETKKIVFKVGVNVDPITGRKCRGLDLVGDDDRDMGPMEVKP